MTHIIEQRALRSQRLGLRIVLLIAFLTPICWWSASQLELSNNLESWLSESDTELRSLSWARDVFSIEERVLLSWDGSSINDPRTAKLVEQLIGKNDDRGIKRGGLPYIGSVIDPRQALNTMQENGIEPQEAARRLEGTVLGAGPLRLKLTEVGRGALKKTKRELQNAALRKFGVQLAFHDPSPDLAPMISIPALGDSSETPGEPHAPTILAANGELKELADLEHDLQISWKGMRVGSEQTVDVAAWLTSFIPEKGDGVPLVETSFFAVGSPVAVAIGISEAGLADKAETLKSIRSACNAAGIPTESLHLAGGAVFSSELTKQVSRTAWNTTFPFVQIHHRSVLLTSMIVCALVACAVTLSLRLSVTALVLAVFTTVGSLAVVSATGSSMNVVLILLPATTFALTMSGAIHLANLSHALPTAPKMSSLNVGVLASSIVIIGLISLATSRLVPIRDFGIFAAVGMLISLLTVLYGLPSLLQMWPGEPTVTRDLEHSGWRGFGHLLGNHSGFQSIAVVTLFLGLSCGLGRFQPQRAILRDFPAKSGLTQDYWYLETNVAGVMPVETIVRFDAQAQKDTNFLDRMELIRQIQTQMKVHHQVSGSMSLADFQPISEQPDPDAGFLQKSKHNKKANLIQQRVRDGEITNGKSFYTISERGYDLQDPGDNLLNQPGDELWRITAYVSGMTEGAFPAVLSDLHQITRTVLKLQPGSDHSIVGSLPVLVQAHEGLTKSLGGSFGLTAGLVFVVLIVSLRNMLAALIAMFSSLLPVTAFFGAWLGTKQQIDVGSIMAASISLGIVASGTLYYLIRFRNFATTAAGRYEATIDALAASGPALWQSAAVIGVAMVALVPAELRLVSQFGATVAAITGLGFLIQVVLLPQLLLGPLGWVFDSHKATNFTTVQPETANVPVELEEPKLDLEVKGPPAPHIKPIDPKRNKRKPTA